MLDGPGQAPSFKSESINAFHFLNLPFNARPLFNTVSFKMTWLPLPLKEIDLFTEFTKDNRDPSGHFSSQYVRMDVFLLVG